MKEFFESKNLEYKEIINENENILTKIIYFIYFLDYSSIFLTVKRKVDQVDVIDFINAKTDTNKVTGANISVRIDDDFMERVRNDLDVDLQFPIDSDSLKPFSGPQSTR